MTSCGLGCIGICGRSARLSDLWEELARPSPTRDDVEALVATVHPVIMHERAQATWAELQAERGALIRSVVNDTASPAAVHDTATGDLETVDQPGVAEGLPFVTSTRSHPDANADGAAMGLPESSAELAPGSRQRADQLLWQYGRRRRAVNPTFGNTLRYRSTVLGCQATDSLCHQ